ncbi:MAG: dihydrofolate reductase [Oscillospiraceae bacterium]|nr:dihydrofolate reductase [Oscillospiraceae bacterium]
MNVIAAVDSNWGIGFKNELLFHIPRDLKFFKEKTLGKTVIMGRKTLESLPGGKPLKERKTLILSSSKKKIEGCESFASVEKLLERIASLKTEDVFVCGGQSVYEALLPFCDTAYITKIRESAPADKFFPDLDKEDGWELTDESELFEFDGIGYSFCTYKKI